MSLLQYIPSLASLILFRKQVYHVEHLPRSPATESLHGVIWNNFLNAMMQKTFHVQHKVEY
jgi:hypothetical protein